MDSKNIIQRINHVRKKVPFIEKSGYNDHMKKKFVGHDQVVAALRDHMIEAGIGTKLEIKSHEVVNLGKGFLTTILGRFYFINEDDPNDALFIDAIGQGKDSNDLGPGKALSYIKKYALLTMFLCETGEKDPEYDSMGNNGNGNRNSNRNNNNNRNNRAAPNNSAKPKTLDDQFHDLAIAIFNEANAQSKAAGRNAYKSLDDLKSDLMVYLVEVKSPGLSQPKLDRIRSEPKTAITTMIDNLKQ